MSKTAAVSRRAMMSTAVRRADNAAFSVETTSR
jgi:hypothetical protein